MTAPGIVPASVPAYNTPDQFPVTYLFDAHQREASGSSSTSSLHMALPQFPVNLQEVFPSLDRAFSQFPIKALPPYDHQVHTGVYAEEPRLSVDPSGQGLYPPSSHLQSSYAGFDTLTHWRQQTSSILPGPDNDAGMPLGYNLPSHSFEQPQNGWGHCTEQNVAYSDQTQPTYVVPAGQLHVDIPTHPVTFNHSATGQMALPVNGAKFYDQWTSQLNCYFPQLPEISNAFPEINLAQQPSDFSNQQMAHQPPSQFFSQNQMGTWFPQVVVGVQNQSQGSNPSYQLNNLSHDDGDVWNTTHVTSPATIALGQLEGSSRPVSHPAHATVPEAPSSSRGHTRHSTHATSPIIDLILSGRGTCNYVPPNEEACGIQVTHTSARHVGRHWFTCHAMKELQMIDEKSLDMSQARIINTPARMRIARTHALCCPFSFCRKLHKHFLRSDSLYRHMKLCVENENKWCKNAHKLLVGVWPKQCHASPQGLNAARE
ncbi:hypothetical protein JB92DRAFT_3135770 [Gautieria morchelliformis]|nr:hypothetical protein JB92DRAFT_3135770 [Gautieria morchelliformis]